MEDMKYINNLVDCLLRAFVVIYLVQLSVFSVSHVKIGSASLAMYPTECLLDVVILDLRFSKVARIDFCIPYYNSHFASLLIKP
jgi:hypothetical protein